MELLSAIPGKCGAVGNLWWNNLKYLPAVDPGIEYFVFVTRALKEYYDKHLEKKADNLNLISINVDAENIIQKLIAQEIEVPRLCKKLGVDIHFTTSPAPFFCKFRPIEIFKITALQFYYHPEQVGKKQTLYHRTATPRKAKKSDIIIANSHYTKGEISRFIRIPEEKIWVVYEAVDHDLFNTDTDILVHRNWLRQKYSIDYEYILFISDLRPYKNPFLLIKAFEKLSNKGRIQHHLVIIGNSIMGYKDVLTEYIKGKKVGERILFLDFLEPFELLHFYRCTSLFVYPSELETFGTPPLEAMASGTPVIVSNKTAVSEVAGEGALHVDTSDMEQLAWAMEKLLTDSELRNSMIDKGFQRAKEFSWKKHAQETVALFKTVNG
ncbi:D-inositol-3-phosphate glycosyltransferase [subsurface metagenome]